MGRGTTSTDAGSGVNGHTQEVRFPSEGLECAATLYLPSAADATAPGLVMGNGFANVRQMYLPEYAEAFAAAGIAVLVIDYRFLGESDGQPRQQVLPESQCDDLRNALTWLGQRTDVDPDRLGLWGVSFAGGHALRIASYDRRVKAVVAQVPAIGLWHYLRRSEPAVREAFLAHALTDRLDYASTGQPRSLAITGPDGAESILGAAGYDWHRGNEQRHPTFHNAIAAHSLDRIVAYDPGAFIEDISPTPLQIIVADHDTTTPSDIARAVFDRAGEPKEFIEYAGGHYDVYDNETVKHQCMATATDFLVRHLLAERDDAPVAARPTPAGA